MSRVHIALVALVLVLAGALVALTYAVEPGEWGGRQAHAPMTVEAIAPVVDLAPIPIADPEPAASVVTPIDAVSAAAPIVGEPAPARDEQPSTGALEETSSKARARSRTRSRTSRAREEDGEPAAPESAKSDEAAKPEPPEPATKESSIAEGFDD